MMKIDMNYLLKSAVFDMIFLFVINAGSALSAPQTIPYTRNDMFTNYELIWGIRTLVEDIFWSTFILGFAMTLIITNGVRFDLLGSRVDPPEWYRHQVGILKRFPNNLFIRAIFIGILSLLVFVPFTFVVLANLHLEYMRYWDFVLFKGVYSTLIGVFIGMVIRIVALGD